MNTNTHKKLLFERKSILELPIYGSFLKDYIQKKDSLKSFYHQLPINKAEWLQLIKAKKALSLADRAVLVNVLNKQYAEIETSELVRNNIQKLNDAKTFTITTGHQLSIYTGPIFFIFKIASIIAQAKQLKVWFPAYNFIPVFWMASEDHDFEEISEVNVFEKKIKIQTKQAGAVGRMQVEAAWRSELIHIKGLPKFIYDAYNEGDSLSVATLKLVNELFKEQGLVILNPDDEALKQMMVPIFQKEIREEFVYKKGTEQSKKLEEAGYKAQIGFREINLFYLGEGYRERIIRNASGSYSTLNEEMQWKNQEELLQDIADNAAAFSPNVAMRPLYQERILPNLAYYGGPAEVAYWLQFKSIFEEAGIQFPAVFPRLLGGFLSFAAYNKALKTELEIWDFFLSKYETDDKILTLNNKEAFTVKRALELLEETYSVLYRDVKIIDPSLLNYLDIKRNESKEHILRIHKKTRKAILTKYQYQRDRVDAIKAYLMPNGALQERSLNVLEIMALHPNFIQELIDNTKNEPLGLFHLIIESEL